MHQPPDESSYILEAQNTQPKSKAKLIAGLSALIVSGVGAFVAVYFIARKKQTSENNNYVSNLGIANKSPFLWKLTQSSGNDASCTNNGKAASCSGQLVTLAQQWVGIQTSSGWSDLEYDVFDANNNYVGHFGVSITPNAVTVSNQEGVKVVIGPYQNGQAQIININANNSTCVINNNASKANNTITPGANMSGYEWGNNPTQINPPTCIDINATNANGFVSLRVPFKLEYASTDGITINPNSTYVQNYLTFIKNAIASGNQVIVEPHNYMQFNGQPITTQQCQQLIGQSFVGLFKAVGLNNIIIEAMNEPTNAIQPNDLVSCYDALIKAARAEGYTGPIILEGNNWGTPNALTNSDGSASPLFNALQPLLTNNSTYGNVQLGIHCYFNGVSGGGSGLSECIAANTALNINRIPALTTLARANNIKISVTEIGVIQSENCQAVLTDALNHFSDNHDIYVGYNWWVLTPSDANTWGPNGYPLLLNLSGNDPRYAIMKSFMANNVKLYARPMTSNANRLSPPDILALPLRVAHLIATSMIVPAKYALRYCNPLTIKTSSIPNFFVENAYKIDASAQPEIEIIINSQIEGSSPDLIQTTADPAIISVNGIEILARFNHWFSAKNQQYTTTNKARGVNMNTPEFPCHYSDGSTNIKSTFGDQPSDVLIQKCHLPKALELGLISGSKQGAQIGGTSGFLIQLFINQGMPREEAELAAEGVTLATLFTISPAWASIYFIVNRIPPKELGQYGKSIKYGASTLASGFASIYSGAGFWNTTKHLTGSFFGNIVGYTAGTKLATLISTPCEPKQKIQHQNDNSATIAPVKSPRSKT